MSYFSRAQVVVKAVQCLLVAETRVIVVSAMLLKIEVQDQQRGREVKSNTITCIILSLSLFLSLSLSLPRSLSLSLSLSQRSPVIRGVNYHVCGHFYTLSFIIFGEGLLACKLRSTFFLGVNKFSSLVCWCTVIHYHRPLGPTLFSKSKIGFYMCAV